MVALLAALSATGASGGTAAGRPGQPGNSIEIPDSVLAVVGERTITRAGYMKALRARATSDPVPSTPEGARRFLELLVDRELLATAAAPDPAPWTASDSIRYGALRDRLTLAAALDSALAAARAETGADDVQALGVAARDSAVSQMGATFDGPLLERVARAFAALPQPTSDSSLAAQVRALSAMPVIEPGDSAAVLARAGTDRYRVSDLLGAWRRLSPAYRPRIGRADQVRDLVANGLFERALRRAAEGGTFARQPDIATALETEREEIGVGRWIEREVLDHIVVRADSLRSRYDADPGAWVAPARARLLRVDLQDRAEAIRVAMQLRDSTWARTLEERAREGGVSYSVEVSADRDSAWFAPATRSGPGAVIGPILLDGSWGVARVIALIAPRQLDFDEVRDAVEQRWYEEEAARRIRSLCDDLRNRIGVVVNERALERLARGGEPTSGE